MTRDTPICIEVSIGAQKQCGQRCGLRGATRRHIVQAPEQLLRHSIRVLIMVDGDAPMERGGRLRPHLLLGAAAQQPICILPLYLCVGSHDGPRTDIATTSADARNALVVPYGDRLPCSHAPEPAPFKRRVDANLPPIIHRSIGRVRHRHTNQQRGQDIVHSFGYHNLPTRQVVGAFNALCPHRTTHSSDTRHPIEAQLPPRTDAQGVEPQAAHFADEVLRTIRHHITADARDQIAVPATQKRRRLGRPFLLPIHPIYHVLHCCHRISLLASVYDCSSHKSP